VPSPPRARPVIVRSGASDPGADGGQRREGFLDLLGGVLVILEAPSEVALVGRQVEMAVAAQVEQDDLRLARLTGGQRLVDRDADGMGRLGGRQDAFRPGECHASLEARSLVDAAGLQVAAP